MNSATEDVQFACLHTSQALEKVYFCSKADINLSSVRYIRQESKEKCTVYRSGIHEHTFSLRFLGIIFESSQT
jgi:hypothetical protein